MLEIPFKSSPYFSEVLVLDTIQYTFTFHWNTLGFWTLDILNVNSLILISGIRLVIGINLISDYPDLGLPKGKLYIIDSSGNTSEITRNDFYNENRLLKIIYIEEGEVI